MAGPIIAGEHPFRQALFVLAIVAIFALAMAKPEYLGPFRPYVEYLLHLNR
jgi:hypothetical protein